MAEAASESTRRIPLGAPPYVWPDWYRRVKAFEKRTSKKALWQLVDTFVPYLALWYLLVRSVQLGYPYAATLVLAVPAAGLLVRPAPPFTIGPARQALEATWPEETSRALATALLALPAGLRPHRLAALRARLAALGRTVTVADVVGAF